MAKTKLKKCIMTGKLNRITDGANQELPRELPRGNILSKNIFTLAKKIKKKLIQKLKTWCMLSVILGNAGIIHKLAAGFADFFR